MMFPNSTSALIAALSIVVLVNGASLHDMPMPLPPIASNLEPRGPPVGNVAFGPGSASPDPGISDNANNPLLKRGVSNGGPPIGNVVWSKIAVQDEPALSDDATDWKRDLADVQDEIDVDDDGSRKFNSSLYPRAPLPALKCGNEKGWQWSPLSDIKDMTHNDISWGYTTGMETFCNFADGHNVPYGMDMSIEVNQIRITGQKNGQLIGKIQNDKIKEGYIVSSDTCQFHLKPFTLTNTDNPKGPCYGTNNKDTKGGRVWPKDIGSFACYVRKIPG